MLVLAIVYRVSKHHDDELKDSASYHQERSNNPVNKDTERNLNPDPPLPEDVV